MDFRRQYSCGRSSAHLKNSQRSSFVASQSAISSKEVVIEKVIPAIREDANNLSKEHVSQVVLEAESMLRSERKPRPQDEPANRRRSHNAKTTDNKRAEAYSTINNTGSQPQATLKPVEHQLNHHRQKPHAQTQAARIIEQKQGMQECLEVLEIVRVFIRQNPVQFADQVQL